MGRRRRILLIAGVLSMLGLVGGAALAIALAQPIVAIFGVIVALAPWGALIDEVERRERGEQDLGRRGERGERDSHQRD